jgi:threonine/homoserine/homoserine lactone efflux protein
MPNPDGSIALTGPIAFLAVSVLVIVTPGQDTLLTVRNTLGAGRVAGVLTAVGVASGQLTWTLAASAGFAAVVIADPTVFTAIRVAGAAYLVFLGGRSLRDAVGGRHVIVLPENDQHPAVAFAFVRQGLISNLGNPKMLLFFTSLLPQFTGRGGALDLVVLGSVFCLLTLCWLSAYAVVVARLNILLARATVRRAVEGASGLALVALGLRIATNPMA